MIRVGSEELNSRPVANAFEAMQGKAAGVDIVSNERRAKWERLTYAVCAL